MLVAGSLWEWDKRKPYYLLKVRLLSEVKDGNRIVKKEIIRISEKGILWRSNASRFSEKFCLGKKW